MKKICLLFTSLMLAYCNLWAQSIMPVTDKEPATFASITMGYTIKSTEVKAVSDKGNFSRYSIRFYVTNNSPEAKIMLYKQGWNVLGNVSDKLAQFNCLNATGARFTSKEATINATECNVLADVDDQVAGTNKTVKNRRFVQIGYWIKPGQTISTDAIMICPLNELPKMEVTYLANQLTAVGSAEAPPISRETFYHNESPLSPGNGQGFVKIRNLFTTTYLNYETNVMHSSAIDAGWWSAQWQLIPIPGTRYFNIKSKWKGTFFTTDGAKFDLFADYMNDGARWILEPAEVPQSFRIINVESQKYLCVGSSNELKLTLNGNVPSTTWSLETP